jgi:aspartate/methionine/tyrosine aminotransferase
VDDEATLTTGPRLAAGVAQLGTESAFAVLAPARQLEEAGVALLAGGDFGAHGEDHLRIPYANSPAQLELGLERIGQFLGG